jgi:hypothetical protein
MYSVYRNLFHDNLFRGYRATISILKDWIKGWFNADCSPGANCRNCSADRGLTVCPRRVVPCNANAPGDQKCRADCSWSGIDLRPLRGPTAQSAIRSNSLLFRNIRYFSTLEGYDVVLRFPLLVRTTLRRLCMRTGERFVESHSGNCQTICR